MEDLYTILWTISPDINNSTLVYTVDGGDGMVGSSLSSGGISYCDGVSPVLYLSSDITLIGEGTESNPYVITN